MNTSVEQRFNHPQIGVVTIRHSARAKRLSIRISASKGVCVTIPQRGVSSHEAELFINNNIEWIKASQAKLSQQAAAAPPPPSRGELEQLRQRAINYLPQRIHQLATQHNLRYGKLSIRLAKSRWGSCNSRNDISLNLMLMALPTHLIDFIILHELCHTIHHNHSPQFHALLNKLCNGREQHFIRELKQHKI